MAKTVHSSDRVDVGFVVLTSLVAAVGGLLFGYDTAVISGAIGFMQQLFHLTPFMQGWTVSSLIVGAIIGAACSGFLSDRFGRKRILMLSAILFSLGAIASATAGSVTWFTIARIVGGIGVGIASTLSPLYISEIAPFRHRGRLVSLYQLAVVIGISAIYFVDAGVASLGGTEWDIHTGWRWMFGLGLVPGIVFLVLLAFVPESPRWLLKQGHESQAFYILLRVNGSTQAKRELDDIKQAIATETGRLRQLFRPGFRRALWVGVILSIFQQVTGINAVMYYAPEIFKQTGAGQNASLIQTILVGAVNLLFTLVALWLIDRVGRKVLLLVGSGCMTICLIVVGFAFHTGHIQGYLVLIFILLFVASFAMSLGPVVWVVISEIFPTHIRGRATAIASLALWAADYLVSQTFPVLLTGIGAALTFWVFAVMSVLTFLFTIGVVPETKEKTLEQIEQLWSRG
ncbi:arabinose-proton symporter [Alicyclobacillus contaminans]|uniref:sugar porter family MFS transporter n=1 Tax=Alicyclobacillus contaminans TaxID=392016 RepID=UPI0004251911|nr:sugar porter family MFS transporter [Alicyclobacillus contaminans]GMA49804.1 arabinose-proton symporter [Alicyclobacillus contaminans]